MTEANDSINAIGKAMRGVEASKTAKQVKDAKVLSTRPLPTRKTCTRIPKARYRTTRPAKA